MRSLSCNNPNWVAYCRALYTKATAEIDELYEIAGNASLGPVHRLHGLLCCLNNTIPAVIESLELDVASLQKELTQLKLVAKVKPAANSSDRSKLLLLESLENTSPSNGA